MSWKLIAQQVPTRSHVQCLQRWKKALDPRLVKGPWSEEEDQLLVRSGQPNQHCNFQLPHFLSVRVLCQCVVEASQTTRFVFLENHCKRNYGTKHETVPRALVQLFRPQSETR